MELTCKRGGRDLTDPSQQASLEAGSGRKPGEAGEAGSWRRRRSSRAAGALEPRPGRGLRNCCTRARERARTGVAAAPCTASGGDPAPQQPRTRAGLRSLGGGAGSRPPHPGAGLGAGARAARVSQAGFSLRLWGQPTSVAQCVLCPPVQLPRVPEEPGKRKVRD